MEITKEFKEILSLNIFSNNSILLIEALAGSGKTTLLYLLSEKYKNKNGLYLTFNKEMSKEGKERFKNKKVDSYTIHGLAYRLVSKIKKINIKDTEYLLNKKYDNQHIDNLEEFITHEQYLEYMSKNIEKYKKYINKYDYILIDEAQDLNPVMLNIVKFFIKMNKPIVFVGDRNQSINSFMNNKNIFNEILKFEEYDKFKDRLIFKKLTYSFRFSRNSKIEKLANLILKYRNLQIKGNGNILDEHFIENKLYAGRTNYSVFKKIFNLIENNKFFRLVGGIESLNIGLIEDAYNYINNNRQSIKNNIFLYTDNKKEFYDFIITNNINEVLLAMKISQLIKKYKTTPTKFYDKVNKFYNENSNIIVGTIHKTKGKTFDKTIIMPDNFFNKRKLLALVKNNEKKKRTIIHNKKVYNLLIYDKNIILFEETNLLYVAITRSKKDVAIENKHYYEFLKHLKNNEMNLIINGSDKYYLLDKKYAIGTEQYNLFMKKIKGEI